MEIPEDLKVQHELNKQYLALPSHERPHSRGSEAILRSDAVQMVERIAALESKLRDKELPAQSCGHSVAWEIRSAETGEILFCDICNTRSELRDALQMEAAYKAELATLREENERLKHDLEQAKLLHESCHDTRELVTKERDSLKAQLDAAHKCCDESVLEKLELVRKLNVAEAQLSALSKPIKIAEWSDAGRNAPLRDNGFDRANRIIASRAGTKHSADKGVRKPQ